MKLKALYLKNFSSHVESELRFDKPLNLILGNLNSGKSSCVQAIEFALTGASRKRDATEMIHTGAKSLTVTIDFDGHTAFRMRSLAGSDAFAFDERVRPLAKDLDGDILQALNTSKPALSATLNTQNFFALEPADQKSLLLSLIEERIDWSNITKDFPGEPEAWKLIPVTKINGLLSLDTAYKAAYDLRRDVKRQLTELKPPAPPDGQKPPLDKIKTKLEDLEKALQDAIAARARLEGGAAASSAKRELQERKRRAQAVPAAPTEKSITALGKALDVAKERQVVAHKAAEQARELHAKAREGAAIAEATIKHLGTFTGRCSFAETECSASMEEIAEARKAAEKEFHRLLGEVEAQDQRAKQEWGRASDHSQVEKAQAELTAALNQKKAAVEAKAEIELLEASLTKLDAVNVDEKKLATLDENITEIRDRIKNGKAALEKAQSWIERERQVADVAGKRRQLETELQHCEALVDYLGPKGVVVQLIESQVSHFVDLVNERMKAFDFQMAIQAEPWQILARGRPLYRLSESERYRLGICFQIAIAKLTGLNFVVCDRAEILTPAAFGAVMSILGNSGLDQAIIVKTLMVDAGTFQKPPLPGLDCFMVTNTNGESKVVKL